MPTELCSEFAWPILFGPLTLYVSSPETALLTSWVGPFACLLQDSKTG